MIPTVYLEQERKLLWPTVVDLIQPKLRRSKRLQLIILLVAEESSSITETETVDERVSAPDHNLAPEAPQQLQQQSTEQSSKHSRAGHLC